MGELRCLTGPCDWARSPPEEEKEEENLQKTTEDLTGQSYYSSDKKAMEPDKKGRPAEVTVIARAM